MTDKPMTREQALEKSLTDLLSTGGPIAEATDAELKEAILDRDADDIVKAQAACVLQARAALALPVVEDKDGERWRRFRALHWSEDGICAVLNPKQNVRLGGMCPSGEHLDFLVDALPPIERAHGIQGKEG
jgi:hypothetical protein